MAAIWVVRGPGIVPFKVIQGQSLLLRVKFCILKLSKTGTCQKVLFKNFFEVEILLQEHLCGVSK